jgi:lysophospholipase L1-like esterase
VGRVLVHVPDTGAHTQQARYEIALGDGTVKSRYLLQRITANQWVSLGVMRFNGLPRVSLSNETWDGRGVDDIAWDAVAIQPLPTKPRDFVVALGDSYSSGEGANDPADGDDYYKETDVDGALDDDKGRNACHRSPWTWSRKAVLRGDSRTLGVRADALDNSLDFQFHACSGARTHNVLPLHTVPVGQTPPANPFGLYGTGQYGEVSQIDKGYLDENTTLVTLSIGGNDARFADVVKQCIYAEVHDSILIVLRQIHQRAPNARIVLMGYPKLFENSGWCIPLVTVKEVAWMNDMGGVMANMMNQAAIEATAAGVPTWFSDAILVFIGKGICGSPETINGIVENTTAGDRPKAWGLLPPSMQSFHPKISGTTVYAEALQHTLAQMGQ